MASYTENHLISYDMRYMCSDERRKSCCIYIYIYIASLSNLKHTVAFIEQKPLQQQDQLTNFDLHLCLRSVTRCV